MPAIPVYSASPVNAAKGTGATPQTAAPEQSQASLPHEVAATKTASAASPSGYHPAAPPQPGAAASLPAPTGQLPPHLSSQMQPTPTATSAQDDGPPAPQPGAVPVPPSGNAARLPPPPKAGEAQQHPSVTAAAVPPPPQMSYPPPMSSHAAGMSTTTAPDPYSLGGSGPTSLREAGHGDGYSHPPGYHQNVHASEFSSAQMAAHERTEANEPLFPGAGDDESVWDTAKKWANAAGNSLAAAENEVWKRINKD